MNNQPSPQGKFIVSINGRVSIDDPISALGKLRKDEKLTVTSSDTGDFLFIGRNKSECTFNYGSPQTEFQFLDMCHLQKMNELLTLFQNSEVDGFRKLMKDWLNPPAVPQTVQNHPQQTAKMDWFQKMQIDAQNAVQLKQSNPSLTTKEAVTLAKNSREASEPTPPRSAVGTALKVVWFIPLFILLLLLLMGGCVFLLGFNR